MMNRRGLIGASLVGSALIGAKASAAETVTRLDGPCVISTWDFGVAANQAAPVSNALETIRFVISHAGQR